MALRLANSKYTFSQIRKLVILRHGQSLWNKHHKWAGWTDVRLSSTGIKQAKQCGKLLKSQGFTFDQAYCSVLTRAIQTLNYILDELDEYHIPVHKSWRLNQKHYGSLTGQNKIQIAEKYGEQKVNQWRRSFDIAPPSVDIHDPRHPSKDSRYKNVDPKDLPSGQNQKDIIKRVQPLWQSQIRPKIILGQNLLISAHGGSARGLAKIISNLSNQEIMQLNLPHATPLLFTLELINNDLLIKNMQYLGNMEEINEKMLKIKNQTKLNSL